MNTTSTVIDFVQKKNPKTLAQETVAVVTKKMKKTILLITLFVAYTIIIKLCPVVTQWDRAFIAFTQNKLSFLPYTIPMLPDFALYTILIALPLILGGFWGIKNKKYLETVYLWSIPLVTFLLNCVVKHSIQRPRPPFELQAVVHPDSYSYVSSHSLVTFCLWAFVTYLVYKNSNSKIFKNSILIFTIVWTLFVGFSRIWIGVHNPTDVIGAYLLGWVLYIAYTKSLEAIKKRIQK